MNRTINLRKKLFYCLQQNSCVINSEIANRFKIFKLIDNYFFLTLIIFFSAFTPIVSFAQKTSGFELDRNKKTLLDNPSNNWKLEISEQKTDTISYTEVKDSATFKLIISNTNGCKDSCKITFKVASHVKLSTYYTLNPGFYGEVNGKECSNGEKTDALITRLLDTPFGSMVVGKPGHSIKITKDKASCLIMRMPGNGSAAILPPVDQIFDLKCNTTIPINSNERFKNTLLSETISLGFNLRLDATLGEFIIPDTAFTTIGTLAGLDGKYGTKDDIPLFTSLITETVSQSVINYLKSTYSSASVANLFDLANNILAGQQNTGLSLSSTIKALNAINEGFSGCRFISVPVKSILASKNKRDNFNGIQIKAYINPFGHTATIEMFSKNDSNVSVTINSITGYKTEELFNGILKYDEPKTLVFNGKNLPNEMYIYKISTNDNLYSDRVVLQK